MNPDRPAVSHGDDTLTWRQLADAVDRAAGALLARGVESGDIVTFAVPNSIGLVTAIFGCWRVGAIPQVLSMSLVTAELADIVALARPRVVVADPATPLPPTVARATVSGLADDTAVPFVGTTVVSPSWKAPVSGGSTGRPKVIVDAAPGIVMPGPVLIWDLRPEDHVLLTAPMHHNSPFSIGMLSLVVGGRLTVMDRFDAEAVLAGVASRRITWLYQVPAMMHRIMDLDPRVRDSYDLSSLRSVWHVGAPCPPWLKREWIDMVGPEHIWELYAGTEGQAGTRINGVEWLEHVGSVGRVAWGELQIRDDDGRPVPPNVAGLVYLRSEADATYRYLGATPDRLAADPSWETLGDVGYLDDGYLYLLDRRSDMILVGGENIYPAQIEAVLEQMPGVRSAAVIGLPDPELGARLHAIVEADPDLPIATIEERVRAQLGPRKRPATYEVVAEPLRDSAGKMRRSQLRAERLGDREKERGSS